MSGKPSKKIYLKDKNGKFAGSVPSASNAPGSVPRLPTKLETAAEKFIKADSVSKEINDRNLKLTVQMEEFVDALQDYARSSAEASERQFAAYSARLDEVAQQIDDAVEMCDEIIARNKRQREMLEVQKKGKWRRFLGF